MSLPRPNKNYHPLNIAFGQSSAGDGAKSRSDRFHLGALAGASGSGVYRGFGYNWSSHQYQGANQIGYGPANGSRQMKWIRVTPGVNSADAVGQIAADLVAQDVRKADGHFVGIFPTGNTPKPMYRALQQMSGLNWQGAHLFHLDEYVQKPALGLREDQLFRHYMKDALFERVSGTQHHYLANDIHDPTAYERKIQAVGGPDLVILGIGSNGHIAFIEPDNSPDALEKAKRVHLRDLDEKTLDANFPGWGSGAPYTDQAVTLGLDSILSAKHIILLATGPSKRDILEQAFGDFSQPPTMAVPASFLKLHPNVTVISDTFDPTSDPTRT